MTAIMILMVPELLGSLNPLLRHELSGSATGLQVLAVALAVPALLAIAGLWRGRSWALWAVLVVLSLQTTIELAALAEHVERALTAINLILISVTALMVFRATITPSPNISDYQRALFAVIPVLRRMPPETCRRECKQPRASGSAHSATWLSGFVTGRADDPQAPRRRGRRTTRESGPPWRAVSRNDSDRSSRAAGQRCRSSIGCSGCRVARAR